MSAIERKAPLAETLAAERVREETEKIILTNSPHMVYELVRLGLLDAYILKRSPDARIFSCTSLGHIAIENNHSPLVRTVGLFIIMPLPI